MKINRKSQTFELEKIIKYLETNESKTIAIAGRINNKKTKIINALHQYMSTHETTNSRKHTNFHFALKELTEIKKKKKNNHSNNDVNQNTIINKGVYSFNAEIIQETIGKCLRSNLILENMNQARFFKPISNRLKKLKLSRITKKLDFLEKHWSIRVSSNKMKTIFPILTTITTIGTSIGTPILSISLLRQQEVIEIFSYPGFIVMLSFCGVAILAGVVSVIFYLIASIVFSKYELISNNILEGYKKLISKHFILPTQNKEDVKKYKKKIRITKNQNYYFNEVSYDDKNYWTNLNLLMVHNAIGNAVCFTVTIQEDYQMKNIFNDGWGGSSNYLVFNVNNYKNGYNKDRIINFLLTRISKDFGYDFLTLYKNNERFKEYINIFYNASDNNLQVLNVLNIFKSNVLKKVDKKYFEDNIDYFVEIIYMYLIQSIDLYTYELLFDSLVNELKIPKDLEDKYSLFKISEFIENNLAKFKNKSLLFHINDLNLDKILIDNFLNEQKPKTSKQILDKFILENKFIYKSKNKTQETFVNEFNEKMIIYKIDMTFKNQNIFEQIYKIKHNGNKQKANYIILDFGYEFIVLQNTINNYQVIFWSSTNAENSIIDRK